jgi:dTDP-4-dehydrorhamnose reductase
MTVLILGGNGQLASALKNSFATHQIDYVSLAREELDIANPKLVRQTLSSIQPNLVVNLAAFTKVDDAESMEDLAFKVNATGAENIAKACNEFNASLVHISTDFVFDGLSAEPYQPEDPINPQSIYARSKAAGEMAINKYSSSHVILRTSWVFGEYGDNFMKAMLTLGIARQELNIISDQVGSPTYSGDIATVISKLCLAHKAGLFPSGIFHYAGDEPVSWLKFAQQIFKTAHSIDPSFQSPLLHSILTENYPQLASRPKYSFLDSSKICNELSVKPSNWRLRIYDSLLILHNHQQLSQWK